MNKPISLEEIAGVLDQGHRIIGPEDRWVLRPAPIDAAEEDCLCFCSRQGQRGLDMIRASRSRVIICPDSLDLSSMEGEDRTLIQVANPRLAFIQVLRRFFAPAPRYGIHPTAIIGNNTVLHEEVAIGPHTVVEDDCVIGQGTVIEANVTICRRTRIGRRAVIHSGAILGADGFSFERNATGTWLYFPQMGGVVLEDDVEVGANTCVARGTLSDTIIGQGAKIDNLVHIAHNVRVGKRCMIIAHAFLGGSVVVGDDTWIGPNATVHQGLVVGRNALVGMGAVVSQDIPDNVVIGGIPGRFLRDQQWEPAMGAVAGEPELETIYRIVSDICNVPREGLRPDTDLLALTGVDSLLRVGMFIELEDTFRIEMEEEVIHDETVFSSPGSILRYLKKKLNHE